MKIIDKYLNTLKILNEWVTISEWAEKVAKIYPDLLKKAEEQAINQKTDTTGLREIAARLSSNVSTNGFNGKIEIDASEKPKKVRWLSEDRLDLVEEQALKEDIEPISRREKETKQFAELSIEDQYRITELGDCIKQLNKYFGTSFELEHAKALFNDSSAGDHHPDNIQILTKTHNRTKSNKNWDRFTIDEQIEYIEAVIKIQRIISSRMDMQISNDILNLITEKIRKVY